MSSCLDLLVNISLLENAASRLAKQMDNTNITKLCRQDFDVLFEKLISPSLKFKTDIQAAMSSPETMTMQDIYRKMALTVTFLDFNESEPVF